MDMTELREALGDAISRLPEREKLVVTLYYYEELTLREIGEVLGVTESRVSQLHTKAILRLKARLGASRDRDERDSKRREPEGDGGGEDSTKSVKQGRTR
jgi:RNA polymerase sigma factor for flagellar operon FliA